MEIQANKKHDNLLHRLSALNDIGIALSSERNLNRLLEAILMAAKRITNADAGTLYLLEPEQKLLRFEILRTDSLGIEMGGTTGQPIPGYFNIWRWILPKLTPAERGGKKGIAKPEAILKWRLKAMTINESWLLRNILITRYTETIFEVCVGEGDPCLLHIEKAVKKISQEFYTVDVG